MIEGNRGKYIHVWLVIKNVGSLTRVKIKRTSFWVTATVKKDGFIELKLFMPWIIKWKWSRGDDDDDERWQVN